MSLSVNRDRNRPGKNVVDLLTQMTLKPMTPLPSTMTTIEMRTLHNLYAVSFLIYSLNSVSDWVHTFYACRGLSITFEMTPHLAIAMVAICTVGSTLTLLLLFLCVENALIETVVFKRDREGFALIFDKFFSWLTNFNCFRLAFLMMFLHDLPMTIVNFWLVSSCRIPQPDIAIWPLVGSSLSTILSLLWRLLMLFYSYREFWQARCGSKAEAAVLNRENSTIEELRSVVAAASSSSKSARSRRDCDECWPVRYSYDKLYHPHASLEDHNRNPIISRPSRQFVSMKCVCDKASQACCCVSLCAGLYCLLCAGCCLPCCYHYSCRKNARQHRHRFAVSVVRNCYGGFNSAIFFLSILLTLLLIVTNAVWLTSSQLLGQNSIPPETSRICIEYDPANRQLRPVLAPSFQLDTRNGSVQFECKPVFDSVGVGFGFNRRKPTAWKLRTLIGDELLTVWSNVIIEVGAPTQVTVLFDWAVNRDWRCLQGEASGWQLKPGGLRLPWPYFFGCMNRFNVTRVDVLDCEKSLIRSHLELA